jgi:hypothetical protein
MKRMAVIALGVSILFAAPAIWAQDLNLFDALQFFSPEDLDAEGPPLVEMFGMSTNGGLYHTAETHGVLGLDISGCVIVFPIPGGESAIVDTSDVPGEFIVPFLQASVGLPLDFEVMLRLSGFPFQDENLSLFGIGAKKNLKPYVPIPGFPDLSLMVAYQKFEAGDEISSKHFSFGVIVSKDFVLITPYAGWGYDKTTMNFNYTYLEPDLFPPFYNEVPVDKDIDAETNRFVLGANMSPFPFMKVFADYTFSEYPLITAGIAFSLR